MTDPLVIFQPSGKRGRFPAGTPVLQAARELGVHVESVCGGRGICGRCRVAPETGHFAKHGIESAPDHLSAWGPVEARYVEKREPLPAGQRLACSARVEGDLVIDVPTIAANHYVTKAADARAIERDPAVRLAYVEVSQPDMHEPLGDLDRLLHALREEWSYDRIEVEPALLASVQGTLRRGEWAVTVALHQPERDGPARLFALWPGLRNEAHGVACDIGSTTIALHLTSLLTGQTLATVGSANPQVRFGEDLMSRVSYVMMNPGGREALTAAVREAVDGLIGDACEMAGIGREDVLDAVFVGNPVMHHLFLGIDPTELGQAPFALAVSDALTLPTAMLGLMTHPGARAYILPCVAGHVGADAAAATLAEGPHRQGGQMLLVDVGTNAEIVLGNADRLVAASSPTGPAFEGAEISCGQRAAPGAIERVAIDPATLEPRFRVIGAEAWSDEPGFAEAVKDVGITGICGSGIIEVVAQMVLAGISTPDGVIPARDHPRIVETGRTHAYVLHDGRAEGGPLVTVSQTDVRAIQLAKAALYAGIKLLMNRTGLTSVDEIRLAGAFGTHIDPVHAMVLGLVPDCEVSNVKAVGNAAGTGARMALLNRGHRAEIEALVRRIEKVETAIEPGFQDEFVAAMAVPNKRDAFPHLAQIVRLPVQAANDGGPRRRRGAARRAGAERDAVAREAGTG